jgi:hypothetical protein
MRTLLAGHIVAQCLYSLASLGIPDLIANGYATIGDLASKTGTHEPSLLRMLRTLASLGILTEPEEGQFGLAPLGATLRSDSPDSLRDQALFETSSSVWATLGHFVGSLRSGQPSFASANQSPLFNYLAEHPETGSAFNRFMTMQSKLQNAAIITAYDFSGAQTVVDLGGGHGATLAAILARHPKLQGVLIDFIIKRVMMSFSDETAGKILRNCRAAMGPATKVLVIDPMLPDGLEPHYNRLTDMLMMAVPGGRCRSEAEFRKLFAEAGMRVTRVIDTGTSNFILEAAVL